MKNSFGGSGMDENENSDIPDIRKASDLAKADLTLPADVKSFMDDLFSNCNFQITKLLSTFPNTHEETLDQLLVSNLAQMQGPVKLGSNWVIRLDAHFIGGGRHYRTWEVADIGLMVIFRKNGKIVRSKLAFLQSKRLYASTQKHKPIDPYYRMGMGRLLVTDDEHEELIAKKTIKFSKACRYKAFKAADTQHDAMEGFANKHGVKLYYLFYNPAALPWSIDSPVEQAPYIEKNEVGCRVVPMDLLDSSSNLFQSARSPSYEGIEHAVKDKLDGDDMDAGWRLEYFVNDLFIACKEGVIDDTPNFEMLHSLMSQKSSPISSAISITFDMDE